MDPHDSDLYSPSIGLGWLAMMGIFILGFVALTEHTPAAPAAVTAKSTQAAPAGVGP
jgi:hypothetical protein